MTEERKKYLASISEEEKYLRDVIVFAKFVIKDNKDSINDGVILDEQVGKRNIAKYKAVIKALKKQFPAPMKEPINYHCSCPKCGFFVDGEYDNYCCNCGQKLR